MSWPLAFSNAAMAACSFGFVSNGHQWLAILPLFFIGWVSK